MALMMVREAYNKVNSVLGNLASVLSTAGPTDCGRVDSQISRYTANDSRDVRFRRTSGSDHFSAYHSVSQLKGRVQIVSESLEHPICASMRWWMGALRRKCVGKLVNFQPPCRGVGHFSCFR